jgi:dethiobiotin synthetase
MQNGHFVTGTHTVIGKTVVAPGLVRLATLTRVPGLST